MNEDLLEIARKYGNPIIDGDTAVLIWRGSNAPYFIDDLHHWEVDPQKMRRIGVNLWVYSYALNPAAYMEYSFFDPRTKKRLKDPLNPNTTFNGVNAYNHFFYMPGNSATPYARRHKGVPSGRITRHRVDAWMMQEGGRRELYLYQLPVKQPVPLVLVYDGVDYLKRASLAVIVDHMIHEGKIQPIALAFLENGNDRRGVEYACSDATLMSIEHSILPFASKKLNLLDINKNPGAFGVIGASFGGLMSIYTGLRMPDIFGKVISQSAVFAADGRDFVVVDLIRAKISRQIDIWMCIGQYDWLLEDNRRILPILKKNGYKVTIQEDFAGHNFTYWRDSLPAALERLFPVK